MMKNRVKITIAALAIGVLAMCGNMTGYATESASEVSTQANADGSTDAGGSENYAYVVTYDLNGGTYGTYEGTYIGKYNNESLKPDLSAIKPERDGYNLTGWWYIDSNDKEQKLDIKTEEIHLNELFPNNTTPTLTAEWTQVVTVTVDEQETETKVAAGNVISVSKASDILNLDKWIVNGSDGDDDHTLSPKANNEGTIEVKAAAAENHVINIDGDNTGFGITKDNAKADFVSYWSPKEGYLIKVKNEIGHLLKVDNTEIAKGATSDVLGIMSSLPSESDEHFIIKNNVVSKYIEKATAKYIKYEGNNVLCNTITLEPDDVQRKIIVIYPESNEVKFNGRFNHILENGETLCAQDLLDNSTLNGQKNEAKSDTFTKYRWTYSVKDVTDQWISADSISESDWSANQTADILNKKFDYSFPYYEFEFAPVWQVDVNFSLDIPAGESVKIPDAIEGVDVGTKITLPNGPEIKGYTFNGWKVDVASNTVYKPESSYEITSANITFTGSWTANTYNITWKLGDNEPTLDPTNVIYKSQAELPIPEKTGYTFIGWKSDVEGDNTLYNREKLFKMPSHDVTMTAQWEINTYTVTYDGNGGTIGIYTGTDKIKYNESYMIQHVVGIAPTRYGYNFLGWKIDNEGEIFPVNGSFTMPARNITLVAQWGLKSPNLNNKGTHGLSRGVGYTHDGAFRIKGDPNNYQDKITFYVPDDKEYTFE